MRLANFQYSSFTVRSWAEITSEINKDTAKHNENYAKFAVYILSGLNASRAREIYARLFPRRPLPRSNEFPLTFYSVAHLITELHFYEARASPMCLLRMNMANARFDMLHFDRYAVYIFSRLNCSRASEMYARFFPLRPLPQPREFVLSYHVILKLSIKDMPTISPYVRF